MAIVFGFELILQSGLYRSCMRPKSYAENVNYIRKKVKHSQLKPEILILGTSVAYQGINVRLLNEGLIKTGIQVQSAACEGAKLLTQHLMYRSVRSQLPHLKLVIHVSEIGFPWTARRKMDNPNRSMTAQFSRSEALPLLQKYDHDINLQERMFFYLSVIQYRKDLRDAVLDPLDRIKQLGRRFREPHSDYVYENKEQFRLSAYHARDLRDCIRIADRGIPERNAAGETITNQHHRRAVRQTCLVGLYKPDEIPGGKQWNDLFFKRLRLFYNEIERDNLKIVTLFAPYAELLLDNKDEERMSVWKNNLRSIHGKRPAIIWDMRRVLDGPNNGDFYYDTIHLNRYGARRFTNLLNQRIIRELKGLGISGKKIHK